MTANDLDGTLRAFNQRRPFRPYLIEFNSGDRLLESHPEAVDRHGDVFLYRGPTREERVFSAAGVCQVIGPSPTTPGS